VDSIFIRELAVEAVIGVYDWEREILQRLIVDIEMGVDMSQAAREDNVQFTVDYADVSEKISSWIKAGQFRLIESAAVMTAERIVKEYPVAYCEVTIYKPGAVAIARDVGVRVLRGEKKRG